MEFPSDAFYFLMVWKVRIQADSEKDWGKHDI